MPRFLAALALLLPTPVLAHTGPHHLGFESSLVHALTQPDHLLTLLAVVVLPVAAGVLIWRRFK